MNENEIFEDEEEIQEFQQQNRNIAEEEMER